MEEDYWPPFEVIDLFEEVYVRATSDALKAVGRSLDEVPAASYKRCIERHFENAPLLTEGGQVDWPEFSDEALMEIRWG